MVVLKGILNSDKGLVRLRLSGRIREKTLRGKQIRSAVSRLLRVVLVAEQNEAVFAVLIADLKAIIDADQAHRGGPHRVKRIVECALDARVGGGG